MRSNQLSYKPITSDALLQPEREAVQGSADRASSEPAAQEKRFRKRRAAEERRIKPGFGVSAEIPNSQSFK